MPSNLADEIERLLGEATAGNVMRVGKAILTESRCIAIFPSGGGSYIGKRDPKQAERDADLHALLHNSAPAIVASLKRVERLEAALRTIYDFSTQPHVEKIAREALKPQEPTQ